VNPVVKRIDKYYGYARGIAGDLGEDLVHHVILNNKLLDKCKEVNKKALDRYVHLTLEREYRNKSSKFYRKYRKPELTKQHIDDTPTGGYDTIRLHTILLQLENEGYTLEVKVFKQCYLTGTSEFSFSQRSGVDRKAIGKLCTFVKEEIRKRYVIELD